MNKFFRLAFVALILGLCSTAQAQEVTTVMEETFSAFTEGSETEPATTDISSGVTNKLNSTLSGWSGRYVYEAGGALKIGDGGYLQTARYDMKANKGIIKVSMRIRSLHAVGAMYTIALNYNIKVTDYVFDDQWHQVSYVVTGASTSSTTYVKITASMAEAGILVDDLKVEQSAAFYPAPVAKQPTQADGTSFTAKWDYISGSTGYYLDVYTKDASGAPVYTLQNQFISGAYTSSYKVTGLNADLTYFYVVRATNGTATSENSNEIQVVKVISSLAAPEALPASHVTNEGFTANWSPVAEAEGYNLTVYVVETVKEEKDVAVISEDFGGFKEGTVAKPVYPSLSEYLDAYTHKPGWYAYAHLYAADLLGLAPFSSNPATLTTPVKDLSGNGGTFTLQVRMGGTFAGQYVAGDVVTINIYNGETLVKSTDVTLSEGLADYEFTFSEGNAATTVEFSYAGTSHRVWIDSVRIIQHKKAGDELVSLGATHDAGNTTSLKLAYPFTDTISYRYAVTAYVTTLVDGKIDKLNSKASNLVDVVFVEPSAIDEVGAAKTVASVRYFDLAGRALAQPAQGVTVVVTTYTDGTTTATKILK